MERNEQMLEASLPPGSIVTAVRSRLRREVCLPQGTMVMSRLGCCQEPCVHLWACCCRVPCWLQWARLPPGAEFRSMSKAASGAVLIWVTFAVPGPWCQSGLGCCRGGCLVPRSYCSWVLCWCPGPDSAAKGHMKPGVWVSSVALLVSRGQAAIRAILTWVLRATT